VTLQDLEPRAMGESLAIFGTLPPRAGDPVPQDTGTIVLLGPHEPGFWTHVTAAPEFSDRGPDPLDRWSARVITALARSVGGTAIFPFGGPPYAPFLDWAVASGRAWPAPVGLLVHDTAGLFVSYRGAIALPDPAPPPPAEPSPCDTCADQPCLTACPPGAMDASGYDVPGCKAYLATGPGMDCRARGCAVRRSCPLSQRYDRRPEQSAFHMEAFAPR